MWIIGLGYDYAATAEGTRRAAGTEIPCIYSQSILRKCWKQRSRGVEGAEGAEGAEKQRNREAQARQTVKMAGRGTRSEEDVM